MPPVLACWEEGLPGVEEFMHLVLLFSFDRTPRRRVSCAVRAVNDHPAAPPVGLFATRSPQGPNPKAAGWS